MFLRQVEYIDVESLIEFIRDPIGHALIHFFINISNFYKFKAGHRLIQANNYKYFQYIR